jgi:hypothetical protein
MLLLVTTGEGQVSHCYWHVAFLTSNTVKVTISGIQGLQGLAVLSSG